jgi:hypothetical protein
VKVMIEKGVPMPSRSGPMPTVQRELMEVGDSYFLPGAENTSAERNRVNSWMRYRQPTWRFVVRKVDGGVRVWRAA